MRVTGITKIKHGGLYRAIQSLGWSQADLARATGIDQSTIGLIINLKQRPTEEQRDEIEIVLGCHGIWLDILEDWPEWFQGVRRRSLKAENDVDVPCERLLENVSTGAPPQLDRVQRHEMQRVVNQIVDSLPPREAYVIRRRFFDDATLADVAREIDVSQTRIQQIETRAINKMRHPSRRKQLLGFLD